MGREIYNRFMLTAVYHDGAFSTGSRFFCEWSPGVQSRILQALS